jgi:esterase/lipase
MNFVNKLVFPKPKPSVPLEFEREVVFVPALKEAVSYKILREIILKNYVDLMQTSSEDLETQGWLPKKRTATDFSSESQKSLPSPQTSPPMLVKKKMVAECEISAPQLISTQPKVNKHGSFVPEILEQQNETLDFIQLKKSAINNLHYEFEKKLMVVNSGRAKIEQQKSSELPDIETFRSNITNGDPEPFNSDQFKNAKCAEKRSQYEAAETLPDEEAPMTNRAKLTQSKSTTTGLKTDRSQAYSSEIHNFLNNPMMALDLRLLKSQVTHSIPVLYLPNPQTRLMLVFFHSNAEDITMLEGLCECIRDQLNCGVMAMEYAGYSIHTSTPTTADNICKDAENLIHFLQKSLELKSDEIMIMGRSIGSGPALHVASKFSFSMVIIISGLLSVKAMVKDRLSLLSHMVDHYFDNESKVELNQSPLLILHGRNDDITNPKHSEVLYDKAKSKSKIVIFDDMPHNNFDFITCVVGPIREFQKTLKSSSGRGKRVTSFDSDKFLVCNEVLWKLHTLLRKDQFS